MRITPLFVAALLLLFTFSQAGSEGLAWGAPAEAQGLEWDQVAGQGALQMENNNTTTPSFADLLPIIIFILAGVGIAIVVVAAGLWIARRGRKGKEGEEQAQALGSESKDGEKGEDDEWGAHWES